MSETIKPARTTFWAKGMNSSSHPEFLAEGMYYYGENVVNRAGIVQTRPGYWYLAEIPGLRLQGMTIFKPYNSRPMMLVAIDGLIYAAKPPFKSFSKIEGLTFSPEAPIVVFETALKSVKQDASGRIELITPIPLVIIQDGSTKAGYYDGSTAKHLEPNAPQKQTPIGLWMEWAASRLWVAQGSRLLVSDIADPTSFTEEQYVAERSSFELPGICTGLLDSPDRSGLLAFTEDTTTTFKAYVRDRVAWQTTQDFQLLIFKKIGCVAGRSAINHNALPHWLSRVGYLNYNVASSVNIDAEEACIDGPMERAKFRLSQDQSQACAVAYENFLLVSVPVGGKFNRQTWALDQSPNMAGGDGRASRAWAGVWSGTRPVQWATYKVGARERCYFASFDERSRNGSKIHIWEAFRGERTDSQGRIACQFETPAKVPFPGKKVRIKFIEFKLVEAFGDVDIKAFVGGLHGPWIPMMEKHLHAEIGSIGSAAEPFVEKDGVIQNYKPQPRTIRSNEFSAQAVKEGRCHPELANLAIGEDEAFTVLVEWKGQMGLKSIDVYAETVPDELNGRCEKGETGINAVNERGEVILPTPATP